MRAVKTPVIAQNIERILQRLAKPNSKTRPNSLLSAAYGDTELLADTFWSLIREGKGGLVGHERTILSVLGDGSFDANDFLSLLRQLKSANLYWFEQWDGREDGLAYYGWSKELEVLLDKLLATSADRTQLEWADVSEPAGSALLFALGRRGIVDARALPPGALPRFARAFLWRAGWCASQFQGWEQLWPREFFGRAAFASVHEIQEVGVFAKDLEPLVEYATPTQLAAAVDKMIWPADCVLDWLVSRGKLMIPHLNVRIDPLLALVRSDEWLEDAQGIQLAALAKLRAQNKEAWPNAWLPLAKGMLKADADGLADVLALVEPTAREKLLLEHLADEDNRYDKLWPLTHFPTPKLIDAVVELLRTQERILENGLEREALFETLGGMGSSGQSALLEFLDDPEDIQTVFKHLKPTKENAARTIPYLTSEDLDDSLEIRELWARLEHHDRLDVIAAHFDTMTPSFAARMLGQTQHLERTVELARSLPETKETHAWRELILHPPEPLRIMRERIARTPAEDLERAKKALAYDRAKNDERRFDMAKALASFGPEDLPAVVNATVFRWDMHSNDMAALCRHFGPTCPETPWIAAFWWGLTSPLLLIDAANVLETSFLPAIQARIDAGVMLESAWFEILPIFTKWDPVAGFDYYTRFASNGMYELRVESGLCAVLERDDARVREWFEKALYGKTREFALRFLGKFYVPGIMPALQHLETVRLSVKHQNKLSTALVTQKVLGRTILPSNALLTAQRLHRLPGAIEALRTSLDGRTWLAQAAETITVWQGEHRVSIENVGRGTVELSLDGRFVLLMRRDGNVDVYEPWTNAVSPVRTLAVGNELGFVVPMPGHRLCTVCPEATARHPLMVWDLETGKGEAHRVDGLPSCVTWLDDQCYVVGTMDAKMTIRRLDTGKVMGKLYGWENHDGGGIRKFAVGNEGKLFAALYYDGTLMLWGLSEGRNRGLGRHAQAAPPAIVADPGSSWVITPSPEEVPTWKEGRPARSLVGSGPVVRPEQPGAGTKLGAQSAVVGSTSGMVEQALAVFVRPNVVALGGAHVDVWDLGASRHLGRWDKRVTALIAVRGKVIAGDIEGNIWEVSA